MYSLIFADKVLVVTRCHPVMVPGITMIIFKMLLLIPLSAEYLNHVEVCVCWHTYIWSL